MWRKVILVLIIVVVLAGAGALLYTVQRDDIVKVAQGQATAAVINAPMTPMPSPILVSLGTPPLGVQDVAATMVKDQQSILITQQVMQQQFDLNKMYFAATSTALQSIAIAFAEEQTAQAQNTLAAQMHGTQAANTKVATDLTAQFQPTSDMWTAQAITVIQTVEYGNAVRVDLSVQAQRSTNVINAILPSVVIVVVLISTIYIARRWLNVRAFSRDEHGRSKTLYIEKAGKTLGANVERIPVGLFSVDEEGNVTVPYLGDTNTQAEVTRRAQLVDAIQAVPPGHEKQAANMANAEFGRGNQPARISFLGDGSLRPVIEEADAKLLEDES
jgi:hypothetical protein